MRRNSRAGRPTKRESEAIDRRLRAASLELFLDNGFDGTTMEAIADAAGITKKTLYAKFPDKRAVFLAAVLPALADMPDLGDPPEVPEAELDVELRRIAHGVVAAVVDRRAVRLRRLAVSEAERFPEFAHATNLELWTQSVRRIVDLLDAHARVGSVAIADTARAANHFMVLVAGGPTMLSNLGVFLSEEDQRHSTDSAVDLYLNGILPR